MNHVEEARASGSEIEYRYQRGHRYLGDMVRHLMASNLSDRAGE